MKRVYMVGPVEGDDYYDPEDYNALAALLTDYRVVPHPTHWSKRLDIASMLTCDAIALIDIWWTSTHAVVLQGIAAYVGLEQLNHGAVPIEKAARP